MDRWFGKVAVVTGASSGIGAAISKSLVQNGIVVVGIARRQDRVKAQAEEFVAANLKGKLHAFKADITKEDEVVSAFEWINKNLGGVDILINNAGITIKTNVKDGDIKHWKWMFELNVIAVGTCTRELIKSLETRNVDHGHVINISSVGGHRLPQRPGNYVYSATKFAAKVITEGLRLELTANKSKLKVTNLSPGAVDTEIFDVGGWGDSFSGPKLKPSDVADAVIYTLSTPADIQIAELTIRPSSEGW